MKDGIGYPKFYIYDSTGVTLQSIPANIGTAGVISLSKNVTATNLDPERLATFIEDLPYTHGSLETWHGYRYRANITITKGSYHSTLLQYAADQANPSYANDIYKMQCVQAYADAGYKIKFTPHNDLEDLWGTIFPVWVNIRPTGRGRLQTLRSDVHQYEIIGSALLSTAEAFYAFSFTHLSGVTNANQCVSFNSATFEYGSASEFSCSTEHVIMFVVDMAAPAGDQYLLHGTAGGESSVFVNATNIYYTAGADQVAIAHGGISSGRTHFVIRRSGGTTVRFYKNGVLLGSAQLASGAVIFYVKYLGCFNAVSAFFNGKMTQMRIIDGTITEAEIALSYNNAYGNWPLVKSYYVIYELDGTGGTGMTETDQSGNSRTLTLVNTPTRTTW